VVVPSFTAAEQRFWDSRKVTCIPLSLSAALIHLDKQIALNARKLTKFISKDGHAITRRFAVSSNHVISERLSSFLEHSVDYISPGRPTGPSHPQEFFRGHLDDWAPIEHGLDVGRTLTETLLSEVVLTEEIDGEYQRLFLIKGHAGSGKTVILRRLAWAAGTEFDKICLYVKDETPLDAAPLSELYQLCKQRIFLFVDKITGHVDEIESLVARARKDKLPLTIVVTARHHTWNTVGPKLAPYVSQTYEVRYLNEKELDALIDVLTLHKSLGHLAGLARDDQREALAKKAGRQLLVALHEATLGKPFSDIILDEYQSIASAAARSLYLTVCVLHRLGVKTRAGLISRVHGIPLRIFRQELFEPLESIVFAREESSIRDFVYETRHSHIAEIVFERVLVDEQDRYDEYVRILNVLDIGYGADREAFGQLLSARELTRLFPDRERIQRLYELAQRRYPEESWLLQQQAMFEMRGATARLDVAGDLLKRALVLEPHNPALSHSLAELMLQRAARAERAAERTHLRNEARTLLRAVMGRPNGSSYTYHSLLKIELDELEELGSADAATLQRKIKDIEKLVSDGLLRAPGDEYLLDAESRFAQILKNHPRALAALRQAFSGNKGSAFIALRLAKMYSESGDSGAAILALKECLEDKVGDKDVHFALAREMMKAGEGVRGRYQVSFETVVHSG
jgi:hypothetical protein